MTRNTKKDEEQADEEPMYRKPHILIESGSLYLMCPLEEYDRIMLGLQSDKPFFVVKDVFGADVTVFKALNMYSMTVTVMSMDSLARAQKDHKLRRRQEDNEDKPWML